ncbi:uncharacterized protein LOC119725470 [Patiria miniata]|uniref:Integrase catalytic domain-containing protein n=1 Tax=Patiria miniata TaxID=46514 RepID=A0A913ZP36_PATMI|nr:uncharacterized protein LOC119725470 [Patiria miniata]
MCRLLGIEKTRTTPYNPKSDGMIERFNRTLVTMVSMMIEPHRRQRDWDEKIPLATFAYRASPQESTGESPNMLMLGREVRLPIDLAVEQPRDDQQEVEGEETDYAQQLREQFRLAHGRARKCLKRSARRQKTHYDRRSVKYNLVAGDFVWLHNPAKRKGLSPKLQCRWEGPYLIVHKLSDVIFRIQRKKGGKMKVVHRDRLKSYIGNPLVSWIENTTEANADNTSQQQITSVPAQAEDNSSGQIETPTTGRRIPNPTARSFTPRVSPEGNHPTQETPSIVIPSPKTPLRPENSDGQTCHTETPLPRRNPPRHRRVPQRYR